MFLRAVVQKRSHSVMVELATSMVIGECNGQGKTENKENM